MLLSSNSRASSTSSTQLESEHFVLSALDALSAHVAILDDRGTILAVNQAWRNFAQENGFGMPDYGVGTSYLGVCDVSSRRKSKDASLVGNGIRRVMRGQVAEFELEYPCHSPMEKRWFVVRVSRFDWYDHTRLIVAHQNVSELKRVQLEVTAGKQRLEAILDNISNGILTINLQGQIESANRAAARIFGYELAELAGLPIEEVVDIQFEGRKTFKRLNGSLGHEMIGRRSNGETFPIYLALNELALDDGSTLFTCIIQDITLRKRIEQESLENERIRVALDKERELRELKNRFLSMMSHELRTPLASISLSYDMLKKYAEVSTPEERQQALDNIRGQVDLLSEMVSDVMTLSRGEMENLTSEMADSDLVTYCSDIVEEFQFSYQETHQIDFESSERKLRLPIDRKLLRRAFTNLLSNAIKYSPQGGRVLFTLCRTEDEAIIQVSDEGIGIPAEDQAQLFEPFHRASNVSSLPGTGLGLAITRQSIERHGGSISVQSQPDQGTTFTVRLPLRNHPA